MTPSPTTDLSRFLRRMQWALVVVACGWVIAQLGTVLVPFVLAALLGWLGEPLVAKIERRVRSRALAVGVVFALMLLLGLITILILLPMVERQIITLLDALPGWRRWLLTTALPWLEARSGLDIAHWLDPEQLIEWLRGHWQQAGGVASVLFGSISRSGAAVALWVVNLALVPVLTFYFLRDWDALVARALALIPRDHLDTVSRLAREASDSLGGFLRGQLLVMLAQGTIYAVGMSMAGLRLGLLIGLVAGLISFVPYLGAILGLMMALIAAIMQQGGLDWTLMLLISGVFAIGQLAESYLLTPRLVGDKIGLHPVAVIFAVMAGGSLFGFVGLLLALPVAAIANVVLRHLYARYRQSRLYLGSIPVSATPAPKREQTLGEQPQMLADGDAPGRRD